MVIDFVGLCAGLTMFLTLVNFVQIACHAAGAILSSFFIIESWHYLGYWYIFGFFSAFPAVVELFAFVYVFKLYRY